MELPGLFVPNVVCIIADPLSSTPLALHDAERERFSVVLERTVHERRGTPCLQLEEVTPDRKSIVASRSFGRLVLPATEMAEAVSTYTTWAAEKMRRQELATASLVVFVATNRFRPDDPQHCASQAVQLPVATADTGQNRRNGLSVRISRQMGNGFSSNPGASRILADAYTD